MPRNKTDKTVSKNTIIDLDPNKMDFNDRSGINLNGRGLSEVPKQIFQNEGLAVLLLAGNKITHIPPEIGKMQNLRVLSLANNEINELPPEIGQLHKLRILSLSQNQLGCLPKEIRYLHSLKKIFLNQNKITRFPKILYQLPNLLNLELREGGFYELPEGIENLHKLKTLDLSYGKLRMIPSTVASIQTLNELRISHNYLKSIPVELRSLAHLETLDLRKNPLQIPPEILEDINNPKSILDYYFLVGGKRIPLNEVKLLFVGQGSIGKTSIVNRITQGTFSQNQGKTEGISINQWKVPDRRRISNRLPNEAIQSQSENQESAITINTWDFGGQEIMHATHQFFLTKRSLYILVLDARLTQEENRVEYWLKIIKSFGGTSPVLIVGNKIDQHPLDINRTGLQKKYPHIIGIIETSALTRTGIEELKIAIIKKVNRLRYVRDLVPENWFAIKIKLEEMGRDRNFITYDRYLELCTENKVIDEISQRRLIGFLHDLGVILHFQDNPRLEELGILNPQWVTNGVYKILNSNMLFQNKGVLTVSMLDEILNMPEYPRGKRLFIVDMMKKFELCYDIEPDKTFLVPDLLPKDEPKRKPKGESKRRSKGEPTDRFIPAFEYIYPVLPSSIITRFIVRMNQKIEDNFVWPTGVVLKIGENKALVKADIEDRKITIAIDGLEHTRRDTLSAIRYQLDEIHASIKGLDPQKKVPVPNAPKAESLKYEYLLKLERAGQETLLVENGNDLVAVNVRQMLSAIESEERRKEQGTIINNYYTDSDGGIIVGRDFSGNLISGNYNKINSAEIPPELKETLLKLGEAVDTMIQKSTPEQAAEVAEDFGNLTDEAVKSKPNRKLYSVSIEGLIKAAENLDKLGKPVISLSRKILSLLTAGIVK